jgi:hypothetical protein
LFRHIKEQFETFDCLLEVEMNGNIQRQKIEAPRMVIEQQFESLVKRAVNNSAPIRIRLSRNIPIYSQLENKWIQRENEIVFTNIAWTNQKGE